MSTESLSGPEPLKIALVQMDIAWENPGRNRDKIKEMLSGHEGEFDLIMLPEMFSTGFSMNAQGLAEPADGDTAIWMQYMAGRQGAIIAGSIIAEDKGSHYNRLLVMGQEGLAMKYDKRHLFRMAGEHEVYQAGADLQVFSLKGWRICPLICYDLRFPVWSRNTVREEGGMWYDLLFYVANWPERRVAHWKSLLPARAIENQAFVAGLNRVGTDGNGIPYSGDSQIVDYMGEVIGDGGAKEGIVKATLDLGGLQEYREKFPVWKDADSFGLYA